MSKNVRALARKRIGFTLVEMVVVLMIIAATAMLVLPRLGFLRDQADDATGANTSAALMSNLETYKTSAGTYPNGFDSLLDTAGDPYDAIWGHTGSSIAALPITAGMMSSLVHSGVYTVYDHTIDSDDPNSSGETARNLYDATFQPNGSVAQCSKSNIISLAFPGSFDVDGVTPIVPDGAYLVAFGVGPNVTASGATLANIPVSSRTGSTDYGRYIAIFKAYEDGTAAKLVTVVDPRFYTIDERVEDFKESGPES